ncbi:MAG: class I SAM-dependent methyltransferase [Gemmatimonadales bacterium]
MKHLLDHPLLYHVWQAPFIAQKVEPFRRHNPGLPFSRVLDVGCGPGTNRRLFASSGYIGIDFNRSYITHAQVREAGVGVVGDAAALPFRRARHFDCVFVNSLLHHLDDEQVRALLGSAATMLQPGGAIHVIDLVVPEARSIARSLALRDRGEHPRAGADLRALLGEVIVADVDEEFSLRIGPIACWQMVYIRGTPRETR